MFLPFACLSLLTNLIILQHAFLNNCVPLADNLKKNEKKKFRRGEESHETLGINSCE